jgi:hypothetical protein
MKQSMHNNESITVDTMIMLDIFVSLSNEESFKFSNKLANFFKN